ncbi:MAG TPA: DUF5915 domain-containing protein, partial [Thermoplasmata archaeon]|nr:DUF5915 domain-containing protein [Thermoplasmata archaeon]
RASRRAIELTKRRARVAEALTHAESVLHDAKQAGIETTAFEWNIAKAKARAAAGDHAGAERLLRRISIRTLDQRRGRLLQKVLDNAQARVNYARERGGSVVDAEGVLADAREALALRDYSKIRPLTAKAIEKAEAARKYARAERILDGAAGDVDAARKAGVNITESRKHLTSARDALRKGVFADVQILSQKARHGLQEARRHAAADGVIREVERETSREGRRGVDVARAEAFLQEGEKALQIRDYPKVRESAIFAHDAVRESVLLKRVQDSLAGLRLDLADLQKLGADSSEFEAVLADLEKAVTTHDLGTARRLVAHARHAAEGAREAHFRGVLERSLKVILINAPRGLDPEVGRQLLRQVDDAISLGKTVDLQALIDEHLHTTDAEAERNLGDRVLRARDEIVKLRQAGQDTIAMEGKLADAAIAVQERRFPNADGLLDAVEHDFQTLRETLRGEAAEVLGRARGEIDHAQAGGLSVDAPVLMMLKEAESAYAEGRYGDTIYISKSCIDEVQRITQSALQAKAESREQEAQARADRVQGLQARMQAVGQEVRHLVEEKLDLAKALALLASADQAIKDEDLDRAERYVAAAEGLVDGAKVALQQQAATALDHLREKIATAREESYLTPEMEASLGEAEAHLKEGRAGLAIRAAEDLDRVIEGKRRDRLLEQQRVAMDKAKSAATKFIAVKKLIEDLRKADIDITGAEEDLHKAEKALDERAFDDVDAILSGLDDTAKELMDELVAAARALIQRAERKIQEGMENGVDVTDAADQLARAQSHFDHEEYADAVEFARAAETRMTEALKLIEDAKALELRKAQDAARKELQALRKVLADLARADISIVNADAAMARAEQSLEEGRFPEVHAELAETQEMAQGLAIGLEAAARDLVGTAERDLEETKTAGLDPGRAAMVLVNAHEAIEDGRYVEAIEYKKVIEDILTDARRDRATRSLRDELAELKASIDAHAKLGADMRIPQEIWDKADARASEGNLEEMETYRKEISEAIDIASKAHLDGLVGSLSPLIDEGLELGLLSEELQESRQHAAEAAVAGDLEAVYKIKGDLQEKVLEAKQKALQRRSLEEVQTLEDLLVQSERLGIPVAEARGKLDDARHAIEAGDVPGFQNGVASAKEALEKSRSDHFINRYQSRMHAVSAMIANAKRLGAEIGESESSLAQAEEAVRKNDLAMADILIKQAEVSIGMQIANFIKNRYPNLVLHLPTTGLQANNWNRYVFEVENRGKLPARNVEFGFEGDVEVKGSTPIAELGVGERKLVEVGLKPGTSGDLPITVDVAYQRMFDENRYELKDRQSVKVEPEGTYLVEDVFLIHSDGRLISHHSRKFREEIDEDIFSGMLTVVRDFVKDSFKRARKGLDRLGFGDEKVLIERSDHTYLATVVVGEEPRLLPLYMAQILQEVETKYGTVLDKWTGLLHQLDGIDDVIKKLLYVATDPNADMGALADSPITLTAKLIDALGVEQTVAANELLAKAQSTLETDVRLALQFIEQAKAQADAAQEQLQSRMGDLMAAARDTVGEMRSLGVDVSQAELLLREAEEAFHEGKYERVREIHAGLHESLERAKGEIAAKRVEIELASLINDIQIAKSQNLDAREAESYLTKIEAAIQRKNYRQMEDYLRRAKDSLARQRRHTVLARAKEELAKLQATVAEAKEVHADLGDVEVLLAKAEEALKAEDFKGLEPLIDRAEATARARLEQILRDRYPRLFLEEKNAGLQANRWNRMELRIENKGDWPAKNIIPVVNGPADVHGLHSVEKLDPNEKVSLEFGVRPREAGTMDLDFEIHYTRPLDDAKHQVTDSKIVRVEAEDGYSIEDAILFHEGGDLICHESRVYLSAEEADKAATMEAQAKALITKAFADSGARGVQRAKMGHQNLFAARGPQMFVILGIRGKEPRVLPLYTVQVLKEIHDAYGIRLENWSGDLGVLDGVQDLVRKLLFATEVEGVSLGPLEDTPVSKIPILLDRGLLGGKEGDFLEAACAAIEEGGFEVGAQMLQKVRDATVGPTEEIQKQIQKEVLTAKEAGTLQLSDEQVQAFVDVLRRALEAAFQAKMRAGIERYWPVSRLAIQASDPLVYDAVSAFRKIIVGQSGAKELDIIPPNETWRGMKIDIDVHMDSVSAAYKLWAKKIEILLRSQDAWKIKAGLDKGEYSVGIEGQKVRIDPSMVSFVESIPEHVVEEPFDGGVIYLDTRLNKDLLAEGYAREIVGIVKDSRKDLNLTEESVVELDIVGSSEVRGMLKPWRDMILREANALEVRFASKAPQDAYVIEAVLGKDTLYLGIRQAQM